MSEHIDVVDPATATRLNKEASDSGTAPKWCEKCGRRTAPNNLHGTICQTCIWDALENPPEGVLKECRSCGERKLPRDFSPDARNVDGLHSHCKECRSMAERKRRRVEAKDRMSKKCSLCGLVKPASDFNKRMRSTDGLQPYCRACSKSTVSKWRGK